MAGLTRMSSVFKRITFVQNKLHCALLTNSSSKFLRETVKSERWKNFVLPGGICNSLPRQGQVQSPLHHTKLYSTFAKQSNQNIFIARIKSNQTYRNFLRFMSTHKKQDNKSVVMYLCAAGIFMIGMTYAGVPLYRMFCQATGRGGQAIVGHDTSKIESMNPVKEKVIKIRFNADTAASMQWNFKPQQPEIQVVPGETALAFYTAKNPTDKPVIGISTYNVLPFEAGIYFNKIQCFCFEEQRLNPHEQVDMPVFFYIDPEFAEDPRMEFVHTITLSYTFFEAKEGLVIPLPGFMQTQAQ